MSPGRRAGVALAAIAIGWALMVIAYDKPEWFFQAAGLIGAAIVVGALTWWLVSASRARHARHERRG